MKKEIIIYREDYEFYEFGNTEIKGELEEGDLEALSKITCEDILNHLRKGIGKMTPRGKTKLLDCLCIGTDIELSIQINYQLDCLRDKCYNLRYFNKPEFGVDDSDANFNSPITKDEFEYLAGCDDKLVDVRFKICGHTFIAGQSTVGRIVDMLHQLGTERGICDDGMYFTMS